MTHAATGFQSASEIVDTTRNYIEQMIQNRDSVVRTEIEIQPPDSRLALPQCDSPLKASATENDVNTTSRINVAIRCEGEKPWTLYVQTVLKRYGKIVVAKNTLKRGHILQRDDMDVVEQYLDSSAQTYVYTPEQAIGHEVNRPLYAGNPISLSAIKARNRVKRGEQVVIYAKIQGLTVKMSGTALMDGAIDQKVRVKNNSSSRTIEARVVGDSLVEVSL